MQLTPLFHGFVRLKYCNIFVQWRFVWWKGFAYPPSSVSAVDLFPKIDTLGSPLTLIFKEGKKLLESKYCIVQVARA